MKCGGGFDVDKKQIKILEFEKDMAGRDFWNDRESAQKIIRESNKLKEWVDPFNEIFNNYKDIIDLYKDIDLIKDEGFFIQLQKELLSLIKKLEEFEVKKMLSGELDQNSCYLNINAGAGGTEACDWVLMLSRMYQRFANRRGWVCTEIDRLDGDVAGIKNITFKLTGRFAYGFCKGEKGVHRLVRISPFDSGARRHTSFASVEVIPEIEDNIEVDIKPDDLRVDTYRSSGAGGQHVNTTDSAVRMTHIPTGIVMTCQNERSQIQNREVCLKMLKSKIYEVKVEERKKKMDEISGEKKDISWGSQIRNYILQPYRLVKDTRTKYETSDFEGVMNGEIDEFVNAYLKEFG